MIFKMCNYCNHCKCVTTVTTVTTVMCNYCNFYTKYLYQQEQMETEPYITTIEDLDKFLEEMETEVTPPVTPKKSNKVCQSYT